MNLDDNNKSDSVLTFPCQFPIKVMGKADLDFQGAVLGIIRKHVPSISEGAVDVRYSKENNYISMTVTVLATSQEQLDNIYKDLTSNEHVMVVL